MTVKQLLKKIKLSNEDMQEIKAAVKKAEQSTTGEIALALTFESSSYSYWELKVSIYSAFAVFSMLLPFSNQIEAFCSYFLWYKYSWALPAFYGLVFASVLLFVYRIVNIPFIDRLIIPKYIVNMEVTNRALRYFSESGIYSTAGHSGILIFVSYLERQVRIIADMGISAKISQDLWNIIADDLSFGIKEGKTKEGFISAIEKCGELLKMNFPCEGENPDELPDGIIIL